ncbi:MAG: hypothetical protein D6689_16275 [Deltaproteobacteria bacterium]|nr:MAG: hypothetical protein D6689_16275 [Deltaproteobacteria bacterium]
MAALVAFGGCTGTLEEKFPAGAELGDGPDAAVATCDEVQAPSSDGKHNPGMACLSCHDGAGAPAFTAAGTAFTDAAGTTPAAGATVHLVAADGTDVALPVAANGNFWTDRPLAFPMHARAGACPEVREMLSPVDATGGDCNKGGCHGDGFRVAIPLP